VREHKSSRRKRNQRGGPSLEQRTRSPRPAGGTEQEAIREGKERRRKDQAHLRSVFVPSYVQVQLVLRAPTVGSLIRIRSLCLLSDDLMSRSEKSI